ncbi:TlpA family protein disulfide reductase [Flavitalea flava]
MNTIYAYLILAGLVACLFSCHSKLAVNHGTNNNPDLLGINTRDNLQKPPFNEWFVKNYNGYSVDSALAGKLKSMLDGKRFLIFMGTWCGDSRREVPRMYKILDYCGVDPANIELIMVSKEDSAYKQSPGHEEKGMNIFRVPDLLVFDNADGKGFREGRELGRIVESPVISLEKDLLMISSGENYVPRYPAPAILIGVFREDDAVNLEKKLPALADRIRPLVQSASELKSYAHVLRAAGEPEKANIILKLNTLIFPGGK